MSEQGSNVVNVNVMPYKVVDNVLYKFIFDENTGAKYLIMRVAEIPPGGRVSRHVHSDEEQAYFVLEGEGVVVLNDKQYKIKKGYAVFIPLNTPHEVINTGATPLKYVFFNAKVKL
jgi:mannose-6-phosphate isomerase-like protein (cupin superfamily)